MNLTLPRRWPPRALGAPPHGSGMLVTTRLRERLRPQARRQLRSWPSPKLHVCRAPCAAHNSDCLCIRRPRRARARRGVGVLVALKVPPTSSGHETTGQR